ncbi:V-type proton ATPase subunit G 3 isoform X1 [Callithrix jacchus]
MWHIYTMEYYAAIKNDEFVYFVGTWMNLETIILSKLTQEQKMKYCIFSLIGKGKQLKQAKEEAVVETDQYRMQTDKEFRLKQLRVITQMKQKNKHQGRYENLMDTTVSVWNA